MWPVPNRPSPPDVLARGRSAELLLKNETLAGVFKEIEFSLWQKFRASKQNESPTRDTIWLSFNLLDEVTKRLHTYVTEAEMQRKADEQRKASAKAKGSYFR